MCGRGGSDGKRVCIGAACACHGLTACSTTVQHALRDAHGACRRLATRMGRLGERTAAPSSRPAAPELGPTVWLGHLATAASLVRAPCPASLPGTAGACLFVAVHVCSDRPADACSGKCEPPSACVAPATCRRAVLACNASQLLRRLSGESTCHRAVGLHGAATVPSPLLRQHLAGDPGSHFCPGAHGERSG